MLAFASLIAISLLLFIFYLYRYSKKRPENFPPGPPRLPLWGSYWFMLKENYNFSHLSLEALGKRYKTDILGLYLGDTPTVVTFSYQLCKELLSRDEFIGRNDTIIIRTRSLGELKGIFFVDGPFWKEQRRFSLRHLRDYGFGRRSELVENFVIDEVKYLIDFLNAEPNGKNLDICRSKGQVLMPDVLYGPLLNSIFLILASSRFDNHKLRECARAGLRFQRSGDATGAAISITPWLRFLAPDFFGYTSAVEDNGYLLEFLKEIVDDHIKTFSDDHHRDFIDEFLSKTYKEGYDLDYKQLLMTVLDFMFPAAIAIGHTLSFYFVYLINNPHIQNKIQEEIDQVVGHARMPTLDDRKNMPYLEATIREGIRIFPLNPLGIPRRCVKDTMLGGYFIPKDTIMLPCVWTAHKDESIWPNPEEFQPKNFLDKNGNLLKKDHTIGFGAGELTNIKIAVCLPSVEMKVFPAQYECLRVCRVSSAGITAFSHMVDSKSFPQFLEATHFSKLIDINFSKRLCAGETFARQNMFLIVSGILQNFTLKSPTGKRIEMDVVPGVNLSLRENWILAQPR